MNFRADINGLRAWAVLLVMLYHFEVAGFAGGFIGVDVFFVISGYLMTAIILGRQAAGRFSIPGFYLSRARRIVPALAVLCAVLLGLGWFGLGGADYALLGEHVGAAMLFVSNLVFSGEAGYFDAASHEKWLLHTWSLSVEWQFYLLYPLLLVAAARYTRYALHAVVAATLLVSLGYALWLSRADPGAAFYILPARAWELLAGGLVYLHAARVRRWSLPVVWLERLGLGLIVLAAMSIDMNHWPGPLVIVPVLGAVLVLLADRQDSLLTTHPAVQAMGRWSYSIYLWHWPLLVAALYLELTRGVALSASLLVASVALGALSYRWVEEPFRHGRFGGRLAWPGMALLLGAVILPAAAIALMRGVPERWPAALTAIDAQRLAQERDFARSVSGQRRCRWDTRTRHLPECRFGAATGPASVAVWGDSHASKSMPAIHAAASRAGLGVTLYYRNGCRPLQGLRTHKGRVLKDCRDFNRSVLARLSGNPAIDSVVLIASWPYDLGAGKVGEEAIQTFFGDAPFDSVEARRREYLDHVVADLCALKQLKRRVAIVAPLPYFGADVPKAMARSFIVEGQARVPMQSRREHLARNSALLGALEVAATRCAVEVLDPLAYLCDAETCRAAHGGLPLYSDDNHLSQHGNALIQPLFDAALPNLAR